MSNHILKQSLSIIINVITFFCSSSTLFNGAKGLENWFRKNADLYVVCALKNKSCKVPTRLFDSSYRDQFGVHSSMLEHFRYSDYVLLAFASKFHFPPSFRLLPPVAKRRGGGTAEVAKKESELGRAAGTSINVSATSVSLRHLSTDCIRIAEMAQSSLTHSRKESKLLAKAPPCEFSAVRVIEAEKLIFFKEMVTYLWKKVR